MLVSALCCPQDRIKAFTFVVLLPNCLHVDNFCCRALLFPFKTNAETVGDLLCFQFSSHRSG